MYRSRLGIGTYQTPEEENVDPLSPGFRTLRPDLRAVEPGLDLSTDYGKFRNRLEFKIARQNLADAFENSKKVRGRNTPTSNAESIRMLGPAFFMFLRDAKGVRGMQSAFIRPEADAMIAFIVDVTGEDEAAAKIMLANFYELVDSPDGAEAGKELGSVMVARAAANQAAREEDRILTENEIRAQRREASMFWRKWRDQRRQEYGQQGSGAAPQGGGEESEMIAQLARGPAAAAGNEESEMIAMLGRTRSNGRRRF